MAQQTQAGWYTDPGDANRLRYWDGTAWTEHVRTTAEVPESSSAGSPRRSVHWLPWALAALVLVVALVGWLALRPDADPNGPVDSSSPSVSGWDEGVSTSPSDGAGSQGTLVECPRPGGSTSNKVEGGRLVGGGLSMQSRGWTTGGFRTPFTYDSSSETRIITTGWYSTVAIGMIRTEEADSLNRAATMLADCYTSSDYFRGRTDAKELSTEDLKVDGRDAYKVVREVHVDNVPGIKGDVVTVVAIDSGAEGGWSFFLSTATIDDTQNQLEVADSLSTVKLA